MQLELRHTGTVIAQSLRDLIARHVQFALGRFSHRIRIVRVVLADIHAKHSGLDKYCGIAVQLSCGRIVRTQDFNTQAEAAFYFAMDSAAQAVGRELWRRRRRRPRGRPWNLEAG